MVQLPRVLPRLPDDVAPRVPTRDLLNDTKTREHDTIYSYPEGRIGKVQIHQSGKMTMVINDVKYDVTASKQKFRQECMTHDPYTREMIFLGEMKHNLTLLPNLFDHEKGNANLSNAT